MKKILLTVVTLLTIALTANAQLYEFNVKPAGSLDSLLSRQKVNRKAVRSLKLTGELNGTDIACIRDMLGVNIYGDIVDSTATLASLDMSGARIVKGGAAIYDNFVSLGGYYVYTSDDELPEFCFCKCHSLVDVKLPSGLTKIGDDAFLGTPNLTEVELGENVTEIGRSAFNTCSSLEKINLPAGLKTIGKEAFYYCTKTNFQIPEGIDSIGDAAFQYCNAMTEAYIPNCIHLGTDVFHYCQRLKSATLSDALTTLPDRTFYLDEALENLHISNNTEIIGVRALCGTKNLKGVNLTENLRYIADEAMELFGANNDSMTIIIPNSVDSIGNGGLCACGANRVVFGKNIKKLGDQMLSWTGADVIMLPTVPPALYWEEGKEHTFSQVGYNRDTKNWDNFKIHVPADSYNDYINAPGWSDWKHIIVADAEQAATDGISTIRTNMGNSQIIARYSLNGTMVNASQKGIQIIRYADGTVRKINVK